MAFSAVVNLKMRSRMWVLLEALIIHDVIRTLKIRANIRVYLLFASFSFHFRTIMVATGELLKSHHI